MSPAQVAESLVPLQAENCGSQVTILALERVGFAEKRIGRPTVIVAVVAVSIFIL